MRDCLILPDLHTPFHHPSAVEFLAAVAKTYKPRLVVCIGDEIDAHTVSRYSSDPDLPGPRSELRKAVKALTPLYRLFPKVLVCRSNHTFRAYRKAFDAGIPSAYMRGIRDVLGAPAGWKWADTWDIDGVIYQHGEGFGGKTPALTAAEKLRSNVVIGHVHHAAGVNWNHGIKDRVFGLSVGCLVNPRSRAFAYGRFIPGRPALGCGVIADGVPMFVPLVGA